MEHAWIAGATAKNATAEYLQNNPKRATLARFHIPGPLIPGELS